MRGANSTVENREVSVSMCNEPEAALNQALAEVFRQLTPVGRRDPASIAKALLQLEARLEAVFPPMFRSKKLRPLPFALADSFLVHLHANNSDEIDETIGRLFVALTSDPTFYRNVEQAILAVVASHHGSKLARTLAGCELDADLYADMVEHADGSRELGHGNVLGLAVPFSSRSAFSPIAGYSSARKAAIRHVADWADILRETPEFGVWAFTLTMPIPPRTWADYVELQEANYFRDLDERFKKRMRDLGMRALVVGREIAFKGDHLHVHRHVLYLGLEPAIDAVQRAWDAALWPDGKPEGQPPAYVDFAQVKPVGGHPISKDFDCLERAMTYALKGRHAPSPWTSSSLRQWGVFVASAKKHPHRYSICKGPGAITEKRAYGKRAASQAVHAAPKARREVEPATTLSPKPTYLILEVLGPNQYETCPDHVPEDADVELETRSADNYMAEVYDEPHLAADFPDDSAFAHEARELMRGLMSPPMDFRQLSSLRTAHVGTLSGFLATRENPLGTISHSELALRQMLLAYESKVCARVNERRENYRQLGRPVPLLDAEPVVPDLPPISLEQKNRLRAAKREKWKHARGRRGSLEQTVHSSKASSSIPAGTFLDLGDDPAPATSPPSAAIIAHEQEDEVDPYPNSEI